MDKEVYPAEVDWNYTIRCSSHQFKPYVYCEMCMVRSDLQTLKEEVKKSTFETMSASYREIKFLWDKFEKHRKRIDELEIQIKLLKGKDE